MRDLDDIWVYLSASPLLHLTLTLVVYQAATWVYGKLNNNPLANPVLLAVLVIVAILVVTGTSYETYFEGAQVVHFLLGPATVALLDLDHGLVRHGDVLGQTAAVRRERKSGRVERVT